MDKTARTERYARCTTPAKRRRDMTVKSRRKYYKHDDVTYLFGPRDAAFMTAHQWDDDDVRELTDPSPLFTSVIDIEDIVDSPSSATSSSPAFKPPVYSVQANKARTARRIQALTEKAERENARAQATKAKPKKARKPSRLEITLEQSILPKHLRDPECSPRWR